ncbi:MAG: SLC13 family permease [Clostridium sp.]|nr:SLC13 family permease [Clostridium sp.]
MKNVAAFIKKEVVLCISLLLAIISSFIVPPDKEYAGYIDYRTLAILLCLMVVMAGLQKIGIFERVAQALLHRVRSIGGLMQVLMLLCFFSGMLITNDVALITFVPFTFTVLGMIGEEQKRKLILPVVAMQTIAANLGSMLTPIGNPQNLYLYSKSGMSIGGFVLLMLPYALLSLVLLAVWGLILGKRSAGEWKAGDKTEITWGDVSSRAGFDGGCSTGEREKEPFCLKKVLVPLSVYLFLFLLCLLAVIHVLPWQIVTGIVLAAVLVLDWQVLGKADYCLLLTFVGFFVFIGNMGRISVFRSLLQNVVENREVYAAIAASQIISNVPAALLLSGFTQNYAALVIGVNLGGLGTLIASMASLISYKYVAKEETDRKGAYIAIFTGSSVCFLIVLVTLHFLLS